LAFHIGKRNQSACKSLPARKTVCHSKSDITHCLFIKQYIHLRNAA
jgi:hypothetical protein